MPLLSISSLDTMASILVAVVKGGFFPIYLDNGIICNSNVSIFFPAIIIIEQIALKEYCCISMATE